jgi:hypothetical protein
VIRQLLGLVLVGVAAPAMAQDPVSVRIGAFLDTYYAWDTGRPVARDRPFTTAAVRHDEFNINLAHVDLQLTAPRTRARVALQAGTSVQVNYADEPTRGDISGPSLSRHLQEAYAGVKLGEELWLDAGIFFSNIGQESWLSIDNPTYLRSFTADYTPYYSSGVRATWTPTPTLSAQVHLINGWQVISDGNDAKAIGTRVEWIPATGAVIGAASFVGREGSDGDGRGTRAIFQGFARVPLGPRSTAWLTVDRGTEGRTVGPSAEWWSATGIVELAVGPRTALALRAERFVDRDEVVVATSLGRGFATTSGSVTVTHRLAPDVTWRTEVRGVRSGEAVWPDRAGSARDGVVAVSSLALRWGGQAR